MCNVYGGVTEPLLYDDLTYMRLQVGEAWKRNKDNRCVSAIRKDFYGSAIDLHMVGDLCACATQTGIEKTEDWVNVREGGCIRFLIEKASAKRFL